jgi:aspartate carbamoyltransferase regulatory subunit
MSKFQCKYCGNSASSISSLTAGSCFHHPLGSNSGKHALYEGSEKPKYSCKYCGNTASSISSLTGGSCFRHPIGSNKGRHEPAL